MGVALYACEPKGQPPNWSTQQNNLGITNATLHNNDYTAISYFIQPAHVESVSSQTDDIKMKMESQKKTLEATKKKLNAAHAISVTALSLATNGMATYVSDVIVLASFLCCAIVMAFLFFLCST